MGEKLRSKKLRTNFFHVAIAYLKENSKIKDKFLKKIPTQKWQKLFVTFLTPKLGVDLYTASTYTRIRLIHGKYRVIII